jgi:uncharacterized protein YdhG (YjbR/CyaY superfamily)
MPEKTAKKNTQQAATRGRATNTKGLTPEERAAMKERMQELKAEAKAKKNREEGEKQVLDKIKAMTEPDRSMAKRIHEIVTEHAPELWPRTWYGMPAYAKDGEVVCFFQDAQKFKARYATFGFNDAANLDKGAMWPVAFALKELTAADEAKIATLVKKAVR